MLMEPLLDQQNTITDQQTQEAADLSLIELSAEELKIYTKNLNDLNELFHQLQELDSADIATAEQALNINDLRTDEATADGLTALAKDSDQIKDYIPTFNPKNSQIEVPMVLENEDS